MLLKLGSQGEDVKQLQEKLGLENDGSFGPITEAKVKEWQAAHQLAANGIIDDDDWTKLFNTSGFNLVKLKGHIPDSVIEQIPDTAKKFNITNVLRLSHFLAQCAHESGNFSVVKENLNYSSDGLKKIFGKYFPGRLNESYAHNPEKIANHVYGGRMGNGNEASGDGYKYCGRGYIQLTGKDNYKAFDKLVEEDIISNPGLVATKYPLMSAAFFFNQNGLWVVCDRGATDQVVTAVTKRVNGGTNGIEDRIKHFKEFYNLLK